MPDFKELSSFDLGDLVMDELKRLYVIVGPVTILSCGLWPLDKRNKVFMSASWKFRLLSRPGETHER